MKRVISFWLIPCKEHKHFYQEIIADLSRKFEAPLFEPHLTVFTGEFSDKQAINLIDSISINFTAITISSKKIEYSDLYTKTFFINMDLPAPLVELSTMMRQICKTKSTFVLKPHISLIYKKMPKKIKDDLLTSISIPIKDIKFDKIKAIDTPEPVEIREHVESWREVYERKLLD